MGPPICSATCLFLSTECRTGPYSSSFTHEGHTKQLTFPVSALSSHPALTEERIEVAITNTYFHLAVAEEEVRPQNPSIGSDHLPFCASPNETVLSRHSTWSLCYWEDFFGAQVSLFSFSFSPLPLSSCAMCFWL